MTYTAVPNTFAGTFTDDVNTLDANFTYLASKLISVRDYGAVGNGTTDDTVAFQAAATALRAAGGGTLRLEPGKTYKLFTGAVAQIFALDLTSCINVWIQGNGATIQSGLTNPVFDVTFIYAPGIDGLRVDSLKFIGGNTTLTSSSGEKFVRFGGGAKNIHVTSVDVRNCNSGVQCLDDTAKNKGVVLLDGYFEKCFYPLSLWCTDDVTARYTTYNCGRSYFPVASNGIGCNNHDISVNTTSGYTSTDCLISVAAKAGGTENGFNNIRLNYCTNGRLAGAGNAADAAILFAPQQATSSTATAYYRNIRVNLFVNGLNNAGSAADKPATLIAMYKKDSNGNPDGTGRGYDFSDIVISGTCINWDNSQGLGVELFSTNGGAAWTGDFGRGIALRDLRIQGAPSGAAISVNAQPAVAGVPFVELENVNVDGTCLYGNTLSTTRISEKNTLSSSFDAADAGPTSWTPVGNNVTFASAQGTIVKRGREVRAYFDVTWPATADGTEARITGLPYTVASGGVASQQGYISYIDAGADYTLISVAGNTYGKLLTTSAVAVINSAMSGKRLIGVLTYFV